MFQIILYIYYYSVWSNVYNETNDIIIPLGVEVSKKGYLTSLHLVLGFGNGGVSEEGCPTSLCLFLGLGTGGVRKKVS